MTNVANTDIAVVEEPRPLVHPATGEILEATPANAAALIVALRDLKRTLDHAIHDAENVILDESVRQGTKTLQFDGATAKVTGGPETSWDVELLRQSLAELGLPQDRLTELIRETVEYRVDGRVAKQLAAANPSYAEAIEAAKSTVVKPFRVAVS